MKKRRSLLNKQSLQTPALKEPALWFPGKSREPSVRRILCPHTRVKFNEFDTVLLEVSRLYRGLPPKVDGRVMRAALDPFYQILAGDLIPYQNLFQIGIDSYFGFDYHKLNKVVRLFKSYIYELKRFGRPNLGPTYFHFCSKWAKIHLRKLKVYQDTFQYNVQKRLVPALLELKPTVL